eukprot:8406588-Alexandrium_andersonii.AAC.1
MHGSGVRPARSRPRAARLERLSVRCWQSASSPRAGPPALLRGCVCRPGRRGRPTMRRAVLA